MALRQHLYLSSLGGGVTATVRRAELNDKTRLVTPGLCHFHAVTAPVLLPRWRRATGGLLLAHAAAPRCAPFRFISFPVRREGGTCGTSLFGSGCFRGALISIAGDDGTAREHFLLLSSGRHKRNSILLWTFRSGARRWLPLGAGGGLSRCRRRALRRTAATRYRRWRCCCAARGRRRRRLPCARLAPAGDTGRWPVPAASGVRLHSLPKPASLFYRQRAYAAFWRASYLARCWREHLLLHLLPRCASRGERPPACWGWTGGGGVAVTACSARQSRAVRYHPAICELFRATSWTQHVRRETLATAQQQARRVRGASSLAPAVTLTRTAKSLCHLC